MKWKLLCLYVTSACISLTAFAAHANDIKFDIFATSSFSDNATRTDENQISERQDQYGANLSADYENSLVTFTTDYRASEHIFAEDSQPDRNLLEGDLSFLVGKENDPADLLLLYSRRSLLNAPDDVDLLENQDERSIYSAKPSLRANFSAVDSVALGGEFTKIDYRYADGLNSERKGGNVSWQHLLSAISNISLVAQYLAISYDISPQYDNEYQNLYLKYAAQLRHLSYSLSLGYNVSTPEIGEDFSSPSVSLDMSYLSGFNRFSLYLDQRITDTSMGNGNRGNLDYTNLNDNTGIGIDQLESKTAELRWENTAICERCTAHASLLYETEDYKTLDEDGDQNSVAAGFNYQLSRVSSVEINLSRYERNFDDSVTRTPYTKFTYGVQYHHNFVNDLRFRIFFNREDSDSDGDTLTYVENVYGISLGYVF